MGRGATLTRFGNTIGRMKQRGAAGGGAKKNMPIPYNRPPQPLRDPRSLRRRVRLLPFQDLFFEKTKSLHETRSLRVKCWTEGEAKNELPATRLRASTNCDEASLPGKDAVVPNTLQRHIAWTRMPILLVPRRCQRDPTAPSTPKAPVTSTVVDGQASVPGLPKSCAAGESEIFRCPPNPQPCSAGRCISGAWPGTWALRLHAEPTLAAKHFQRDKPRLDPRM